MSVVVGAAAFAFAVVGHMRLEESIYAASTGDPTVLLPSPSTSPKAADARQSR